MEILRSNRKHPPKPRITKVTNTQTSKLPPQAVDMEAAVLGSLMQFPDVIPEVVEFLKPRMCYKTEHQIIYQAIIKLYDKEDPVDIMTVTKTVVGMGKSKEVDAYFISQLTGPVSSDGNTEYHARIVQQQYILREMIRLGAHITKTAYEPETDCFELIEDTDKRLGYITGMFDSRQERDTASLIDELNKEDIEYANQKTGVVGLQSGLTAFDEKTGGFMKTDLIIISGRPGMGKSAKATTILLHNAKKGIPVALFTLEVGSIQAVQRFLAQISGIEVDHIRRKRFDEGEKERYEEAKKEFAKLPIYIDDTPALTKREFRSKSIRMKRKYGIELIVADYIGLFQGDGDTREQKVGSISMASKALAKELDIPIIQLAQLSRAPEKRNNNNPRPILSDLRDSGSLEQDADMVVFIYRPEYYKKKTNEQGQSLEGVAELNIAKFRNGDPGKVTVGFVAKTASFEDLKEQSATQVDVFTESTKEPEDSLPF